MKTFLKSLWISGLIIPLRGIGNISCFTQAASSVPTEYYPNYKINNDLEKIQGYFVQLEAAQKMGGSVSSELFRQLNTHFKIVFPSFPQDHTFKVIYEQCIQLSNALAENYSTTLFQGFMNNCYKQLSQTITKINSKYTIQVSATRNPGNGAAPLTVTFDARASKDPSNETIPSKNYYRYYRDTKGDDKPIGMGNVISYTFEESGNYTIHLTVRSSNVGQGILDGEMNLNVDVAPKAANIVVYANTKKLSATASTKIGTQEAKKGVIFDGSTTMPTGARKIQSHKREITNRDGFKFTKEGGSNPGYINVPLNGNGEYLIKLSTIDNENNTVSETFSVVVSDPVAVIKQAPTEGTTSTMFSFDANGSYSLTARLKLYTWEIFDAKGDKIDTFQSKSIKKQFLTPGNYLVRLTVEDDLGQNNVDIKEVYVESSAPIPQFSITPTNKWTYPSEFYLDANATTDVDVVNKSDSLEYKREFSNPKATTIISSEENNSKVVVQFDEVGKHTIKLVATDMYGKSATRERQVDVASTLRPELTISPNAITRGKNITFTVKANKPIINYQRSFGDGTTNSNQESVLYHKYEQIGIYNITVNVTDQAGNSNSVNEKVFIGETGFPITAFKIKNSRGFFLQTTESCEVQTEEGTETLYPAYVVDRYQNIMIDPSISVNSKGTNLGLTFYFQPKYEEVYKQTSFTHKFSEVGCQYIDLTIDDTAIQKQDHARIWFKIVNALPTLQNIVLSYPQYGNESGIGFQENNVQNVLDPISDTSTANLIVKATATNALDPDGSIAYFKWYYYPKDNPNKILETKITPSNIPYTFFTLPRIAGEFMFGVTLYDNDGGIQKSETLIGNGPTILFPPTNNNPDIPVVTLKSDKQTVNVGDTVTFDVIAKVLSDNDDFLTDRTIQYDFDGDGEWDLITAKDRVTHVYTTPMERGYTPKAAVIYRGYKGIGEGNTVIVKNGVKPILSFNSIKNIVIFRDLSVGNIIQRQLCFDTKECAAGNRQYRRIDIAPSTESFRVEEQTPITQNRVFLQKYPSFGTYEVSIDVKSNQGIDVKNTYKVETSNTSSNGKITSGINLLTIPETSFNNTSPEIYVGKTMNNQVLFYLNYEYEGRCYIDTDISIDTNKDRKTDNDQDIPCNTLQMRTYTPQFESIIGRIYFDYNDKLVFKNFSVSFEGFDIVMDQNYLLIYQDITTLINGIEETTIGNADLKTFLDVLRKNLLDRNQTSANLVALENHLKTASIAVDAGQKSLLDSVISRLSNADTVSAMGGTAYDKAKAEIQAALPYNLRAEVSSKFAQFEASVDNSDDETRYNKLSDIFAYIKANAEAYQMDVNDVDGIVLKELCNILQYYNLSTYSKSCSETAITVNTDAPVENITDSGAGGGLPGRLKVILRVVFGGIAIVGVVIVFFAIKAKLKANAEAEEEGEDAE